MAFGLAPHLHDGVQLWEAWDDSRVGLEHPDDLDEA